MTSLARRMSQEGSRCHQMAKMALGIALKRLETEAEGGVISLDQVRSITARLSCDNALLAACCGKMAKDCQADFSAQRYEVLRRNFLGRVLVRPLAPLLDDPQGGIERGHLAQFFTALRMMLGNETHAQLAARAEQAALRHRGPSGTVEWAGFHDDPDMVEVYETALVAVARAFLRFEVRQDWLLTIMNSTPKPGLRFERRHIYLLLSTLFAPQRIKAYFSPARREEFIAKWGEAPEKLFGPLLAGMSGLGSELEK